ncbi:MAG: hypothetical protein IKR59_00805, partial [Lachnospiraceae bacterium]|nr:hypothetical protein [Lachnospiraceae bacterium]
MALTILYGSSISVKTEKLYDRILREAALHPERSYVLLVPEQASLYVQGEMVRRAPSHALLNIDILTFNRLAYRVFSDFPGEKHTALDDIGKRMLLRIVLREQEKELHVLSRNLKKEGFLDELQSVFSELAEYNVSPQRLKEGAEALSSHPGLQAKLSEIALIYDAFLERLHRNYEMAEERLTRLSERLPAWPAASKTVFALTGFTGFTPPQEAVIRALLRQSPDILLTADLGSGRSIEDQKQEDDLFHMSYVMCARTKALAAGLGCPVFEETVTEEKPVSAAVRAIERGLFAWRKEKASAEDAKDLRIVKAAM